MSIDLQSITIPDVSVVPEPTAEDWKFFCDKLDCQSPINRLVFGFARRCRTLEAEIARKEREINELYGVIAELKGEPHGD